MTRTFLLLSLLIASLVLLAPKCHKEGPNGDSGLTDVSADLLEVLEDGTLPGSCDAYWAAVDGGTATRAMELRCGKEMFFYEGFDTIGVPTPLVDYLIQNFPVEMGSGFSALGMIPDPTSAAEHPLGLAPGQQIDTLETLAFTCASCHFGQLPDGRFSVGAANHDLEYGKLNVAMATFPIVAAAGPAGHDPDAVAWIAPMLQRLQADPALFNELIQVFIQLLPAVGLIPEITPAIENAWVNWKAGTMDFLMPPVPFDDEVHTISKIQALWEVPDARDVARYRMDHALLGFTGVSHSLESFLEGFVELGAGDEVAWTPERLAPLAQYIYTLRAPRNPNRPVPSQAFYGGVLFYSEGCVDCHRGAGGASVTVHDFAEIGVDTAMMYWADPELDGTPCCGLDFTDEPLTQGIVSARLRGMWTQKRFLHNGSVDSLDDLLCKNGPRPTIVGSPWSDQGHLFGCDLSDTEKDALLAFLLTK